MKQKQGDTMPETQKTEQVDLKRVQRKNSFITHGSINIALPFAIWIPTFALLMPLLMFAGLMNIDITIIIEYLCYIPLCIPTTSCIIGIIRSLKYIKSEKAARICFCLSIIGILLYAVILAYFYLIGPSV